MDAPPSDTWASIQSGLNTGLNKARDLAGQANQGLVARGVTPLGGAALGAGAIGAAVLLHHLLSKRQEPEYADR